MERSVEESWNLITGWLAQHLPAAHAALEPPASPAELAAVADAMGRPLPEDLVSWLKLCNGIRRENGSVNLLPVFYTPMPCDEMLGRRRMLRKVFADQDRDAEHDPAGSYSFDWLDAFLPIGDAGTDIELFVDLRDGDLFGCIGEIASDGEYVRPYWPSTTAMLSDVAEAFAFNRPVRLDYGTRIVEHLPYLQENWIRWSFS